LITDTSPHKDYLEALPEGKPKGTIVLIHGFPDISLGWRYQIPHFVKLGYRTIALDCMGYGKTVHIPYRHQSLPFIDPF
jgi:alpha-beta hydrolase superfamily lysophospholipase